MNLDEQKAIRDLLMQTLIGIDVVATRELEHPFGSEPTAELTIIMHAARAAQELLGELTKASAAADDDDDESAGDGKPPKLSLVD